MRTDLVISFAVIMMVALPLAAQTPVGPAPPAPPQPSGTPPPLPRLLPLPPIDQRPEVLLQVQQLALSAYPELRTKALQVRVETGSDGPIVTYAEADQDGDTLIARSRPRGALLVVETSFDSTHTLTRAILRGALAHSAERRRVRALTSEWSAALDREGAAFPPAKQATFVNQIDLRGVKSLLGSLTRQAVQFEIGPEEEGLYWRVATSSASGETIALDYEPFGGRLVRVVKGGIQ
jgi:hypothetical protein